MNEFYEELSKYRGKFVVKNGRISYKTNKLRRWTPLEVIYDSNNIKIPLDLPVRLIVLASDYPTFVLNTIEIGNEYTREEIADCRNKMLNILGLSNES